DVDRLMETLQQDEPVAYQGQAKEVLVTPDQFYDALIAMVTAKSAPTRFEAWSALMTNGAYPHEMLQNYPWNTVLSVPLSGTTTERTYPWIVCLGMNKDHRMPLETLRLPFTDGIGRILERSLKRVSVDFAWKKLVQLTPDTTETILPPMIGISVDKNSISSIIGELLTTEDRTT